MILECYAIRQKSTGYFLPMWTKARGYHSYNEPTKDAFPRLFKTEKSARSALNIWLQGLSTWTCGHIFTPIKVEGRDKSDMEIVRLALTDDRGALQFFDSILKDESTPI